MYNKVLIDRRVVKHGCEITEVPDKSRWVNSAAYKPGADTTKVTKINSELLKRRNVIFVIIGFQCQLVAYSNPPHSCLVRLMAGSPYVHVRVCAASGALGSPRHKAFINAQWIAKFLCCMQTCLIPMFARFLKLHNTVKPFKQ